MESFGIVGLKYFIIHEDKKIIEKILPGIEKIQRKADKNLTLVKIKFGRENFMKLSKKDISQLIYLAKDFIIHNT